MIKIEVFWLNSNLKLENIITAKQNHTNNITEIKTWKENLENCDWLITNIKNNFSLWVYTADCCPIAFYDDKNYWIIHAWWRWLTNGIIEKMLEKFEKPNIYVWPFLKKFEIQKDFCYFEIENKFWNRYFKEENWKIIFDFEKAVKSILPKNAIFDSRDTFFDKNLASWRRDKNKARNYTTITNY